MPQQVLADLASHLGVDLRSVNVRSYRWEAGPETAV